jgi:peptidoglycan/xylan/chitin deacetylase (PgdA/CDA1 family)
MKVSIIKEVLARLFYWSGIPLLVRLCLWKDRVLILAYHNPKPKILDQHLRYLSGICKIISLNDFLQFRPSKGGPLAVITLDDGHLGNAELLEVFKRWGVRPTIFICSKIVNTNRQFWWLHPTAIEEGVQRLKAVPNFERLARLRAGGFQQDANAEQRTALSSRDISAMRSWVDFQSHSRFHPILTSCDDVECELEISESRREIELLVGRSCVDFCYPNGNYSEREEAFVKAAGYRSARTLELGWNDEFADPFRLKALVINDESSIVWFASQLSLVPALLARLFAARRSQQF